MRVVAKRIVFEAGRTKSGNHHLRNLAVSMWLARNASEEKLLAWRAAHDYFGVQPAGMERAAARLFGKSVSELDAGELASLVGLLWAPINYVRYPKAWTARRDFMLGLMLDRGIIDEANYRSALSTPLLPGAPTEPPDSDDDRGD